MQIKVIGGVVDREPCLLSRSKIEKAIVSGYRHEQCSWDINFEFPFPKYSQLVAAIGEDSTNSPDDSFVAGVLANRLVDYIAIGHDQFCDRESAEGGASLLDLRIASGLDQSWDLNDVQKLFYCYLFFSAKIWCHCRYTRRLQDSRNSMQN